MLWVVVRSASILKFITVPVSHFVTALKIDVIPFYGKLVSFWKIGAGPNGIPSSWLELKLTAIDFLPIACPIESAP